MQPRNIDNILLNIMAQPGLSVARAVEEKRALWCQTVASIKPGTNADTIRATADLIIECARRLGTVSMLDPAKLFPFFLRCTLNWIVEGRATLETVVDRLPTTVEGVGLMAVAEGVNPMTGRKLSANDLKAAQQGGKLKLQ
jgi:hypothetical protein